MEVVIQRILLQARAVDKAIKVCITTAQTLRPLGGDAPDIVYEKRVIEPSENPPFLKWLRIRILQKLDQDISGWSCSLRTLRFSEAGDDEIRMGSDI
jgi:hypothetical protein